MEVDAASWYDLSTFLIRGVYAVLAVAEEVTCEATIDSIAPLGRQPHVTYDTHSNTAFLPTANVGIYATQRKFATQLEIDNVYGFKCKQSTQTAC